MNITEELPRATATSSSSGMAAYTGSLSHKASKSSLSPPWIVDEEAKDYRNGMLSVFNTYNSFTSHGGVWNTNGSCTPVVGAWMFQCLSPPFILMLPNLLLI